MRGDENSFTRGVKFFQQNFQLHARFGIQAGGRLVEDQQRRIVNDGAADSQALFHSAREAVDQVVALGFQVHQADDFVHARGNCGRIHFVGAGEVVEIFPNLQVVVEREKIREVADVALRFFGLELNVNSLHRDAPGGGHLQAANHFQRGGFAGAVGADQAEEFAVGDVEVQAVGGDQFPALVGGQIVLLGHLFEANHFNCAPSCARRQSVSMPAEPDWLKVLD